MRARRSGSAGQLMGGAAPARGAVAPRTVAPGRTLAPAPASLPAQIRRHQRFLLAELRSLAAETHLIHRIWYKGRTQFRSMRWWRPLHRVRKLCTAIATGTLAQTVPLARTLEAPHRGAGSAASVARSDDGATPVYGVAYLDALAFAYASLWHDTATTWEHLPRFGTPATGAGDERCIAHALAAAEELRTLFAELARACLHCYACVRARSRL
ncbi:hypothetical protein MSPP1_002466 [Malassezia sp. CBS 17886]|nr:hypothetical protein MSPP1_002466 [Malassezia sp. CBS 17886]